MAINDQSPDLSSSKPVLLTPGLTSCLLQAGPTHSCKAFCFPYEHSVISDPFSMGPPGGRKGAGKVHPHLPLRPRGPQALAFHWRLQPLQQLRQLCPMRVAPGIVPTCGSFVSSGRRVLTSVRLCCCHSRCRHLTSCLQGNLEKRIRL